MNQSRRTDPTASESTGQRIIAGVLRSVLRLMVGRAFQAGSPVEQQRRRLLQATRLTFPPRGSSFSAAVCGGVPGEWVTARTRGPTTRTILYLHGGGYVAGSPRTHRVITGHLAARCGARVFAADYRLAPELPFPAALDDAAAAYRGLLAEGIAPGDIVIAGDSAGGGLSVATALRLRELEQPLPHALVLFSPWVDLSLEQLPHTPPGEVMLTP
jgi:acetyl esterase/lipase